MKKVVTFLCAMGLLGCGAESNSKVQNVSTAKVTFMPENTLHLEDGLVDNGMTEELFNQIIDQIEAYYKPIIKRFGGKLVVERNWDDNTVNAYANQSGSTWTVAMFGGLARRPEITPDGFAMVVCHELGHHLAGFPISSWAAIEGQSDYFALHACASNLWEADFVTADDAESKVDATAKNLCDTYYTSPNTRAICYRKMNASYSLATLLAALNNSTVSFDTPDKTIVKKTSTTHPKAQCRLDTYVASSLCEAKWNDAVMPKTEKESAKYLCTSPLSDPTYSIKARPRCWFKPTL